MLEERGGAVHQQGRVSALCYDCPKWCPNAQNDIQNPYITYWIFVPYSLQGGTQLAQRGPGLAFTDFSNTIKGKRKTELNCHFDK